MTQATVDGVERYRAQIRITRLIYLGGAAFIGVIGAYFASVALLGPGWTPLSLLATVLAFLMAVVLAVGASGSGHLERSRFLSTGMGSASDTQAVESGKCSGRARDFRSPFNVPTECTTRYREAARFRL